MKITFQVNLMSQKKTDEILINETENGVLIILPERCKGCNFCIEFCPLHVLESTAELNNLGYIPPRLKPGSRCTTCGFCQWVCPDFAIYCVKNPNGSIK